MPAFEWNDKPEDITARMQSGDLGDINALVAAVQTLIEAGDAIRCYPSGAVGFDEWYEAQAQAQAVLGQFLDEEGNWHPIVG